MSSYGLVSVFLLACTWAFTEAQTSCKGRCGMGYYRGYMCQCDYSCLLYGECCRDYERLCTSKNSCRGRCGETFRRGQTCDCDSDCVKFKKCCPDYNAHCNETEEVEGDDPVKPDSCDNNVEKKSTDLPPESIEEPHSESNDPGDNFLPPVNPTSYPSDDPDSASKQVAEVQGPEPSPPTEGASGFGSTPSDLLEDFTTGPPLPDLDGFEILPEAITTTTVSKEETTQSPTTVIPSTTEVTANTDPPPEATETPLGTSAISEGTELDADNSTNAPESTEAELLSSQPPTEAATLPTDNETTTAQTAPAQMNENSTSTSVPPSEMPGTTPLIPESEESTATMYSASTVVDTTEVTTIVPTTINKETTATPEITTANSNPSTLAPSEVSTISSANSEEVNATTVKVPDVTEMSTAAPTSKPDPEKPNLEEPTEPALDAKNPEEVNTTTVKVPDVTQSSTAAPTSKPDPEKPTEPVLDTENPEEVNATTIKVPDVTEISTTAPTSKPDPEKPNLEEPTEPALDAKNPEEVNTTTVKVPDVTQSSTAAPTSKPDPVKPKPEKPFEPPVDPDNKPVINGLGDSTEYPADDSNDMDLCSGRPISGVTSLSNGTVVVFRGHFFWVLDRNRVPGPAQSITQVWGIPSPIDTVFTRCNCQGKTYIFKGPLYWRYENAVLDPGFPKRIETGFDGLRGQVTAALSVPQYNRRVESVYFFKRGGNVQRYSYQFGTNPSCGRRVHLAVYTHHNRIARQVSVQVLGPSINYRKSWRGFPTTITAAVSIPNKREPEGYSYYVFSRTKSYKVQIEGERPVIATPKPSTSPQSNEVFKCPKKVPKSQ